MTNNLSFILEPAQATTAKTIKVKVYICKNAVYKLKKKTETMFCNFEMKKIKL